METTRRFYSLYQITLTKKVTEKTYNYSKDAFKEELESAAIAISECFTHLHPPHKDGLSSDKYEYCFFKNFKDIPKGCFLHP